MTGVEKQIVESTHHEVVNEQNATNQVELSLTSGINTSAGKTMQFNPMYQRYSQILFAIAHLNGV